MAGTKGKSGPPGNLNNSRHPWRSFWRRRALKSEDKWILPVIEQYASGLAADKPGLTEAEARLIEIGQISRGATMLILAECARSGFVVKEDGTWNLSPGAKELVRFLSVERRWVVSAHSRRRCVVDQLMCIKARYRDLRSNGNEWHADPLLEGFGLGQFCEEHEAGRLRARSR